jgi:hypothetical protein
MHPKYHWMFNMFSQLVEIAQQNYRLVTATWSDHPRQLTGRRNQFRTRMRVTSDLTYVFNFH